MPRLDEPDPLSEAIGRRVRGLRLERGLTLEKLAHESGTIAKGHLSDIENGRVRPTIQTLKSIADQLDVEILDLVNFPEDGARSALIEASRRLTPAALAELLLLAQQSPRVETDEETGDGEPFTVVRPRPGDRYVTCVPLVGIDLAAGGFAAGPTDPSVTWVKLGRKRKLHRGMFVARVVGRSMEPRIPDGSHCLFNARLPDDLQGRTLLVQHRNIRDDDTGTSYTVKRFERVSSKRVRLLPDNPGYGPIELRETDGADVRVVAEFIEVLTG